MLLSNFEYSQNSVNVQECSSSGGLSGMNSDTSYL